MRWGIGGLGDKVAQNLGIYKIDRAILACYGDDLEVNPKEIARIVGIHYTNVYKRLKKPVMMDAMVEIKGSLDEILSQGKRLAAKKMKQLIMSSDDSIALRASTELLKAELSGESTATQPIRFITVVNEVGVLESQPAAPSTTLDIDVIPAVTKPTD